MVDFFSLQYQYFVSYIKVQVLLCFFIYSYHVCLPWLYCIKCYTRPYKRIFHGIKLPEDRKNVKSISDDAFVEPQVKQIFASEKLETEIIFIGKKSFECIQERCQYSRQQQSKDLQGSD